jgi:hypothetical protein
MQEQQVPNIDFKSTSPVTGADGYVDILFGQAFIIRKVSKFLVGSEEDALIPIPVFYDLNSKKIILDSIPVDIRDEYKDFSL